MISQRKRKRNHLINLYHNKSKINNSKDIDIDVDRLNVEKEKSKVARFDFLLLLCVLILSSFGVLIIYSATKYSLPAGISDPQYYFKKQLIVLIASIGVFLLFLLFDYRKLKKFWVVVFIINIALLVSVLIFGYEINSNKAWIDLKFISIQPSEFSKIFMVICLAATLSRWQSEKKDVVGFKKVASATGIAFLTILLVLLEPDLGQAIVYFLVFIGILFISGANLLYIIGIIILASGAVFAGIKFGLIQEYQLDRLLVFLKPDVKPEGAGYNLFQSKLAIGSGKLFGKGLFLGTQTNLNYVPEHHTDFIFSVIGEELGFVGAFFTIVLFGIIIWRCFYISRHASDFFGFLLAGGIGFIILTQVIINIGMTIGLMPIIGITLPFLSYGGSNLLSIFIGIALVENVYFRRELRRDYEVAYEEFS